MLLAIESTRLPLLAGNVALIATFLMSLAFVVTYAFAPWWLHQSGRNVMALMMAITLITGLSCLRLLYSDREWFIILRVAVLGTVPIIIAWRLWMLVRVQFIRPRSPLDEDHVEEVEYDDDHDPVDEP